MILSSHPRRRASTRVIRAIASAAAAALLIAGCGKQAEGQADKGKGAAGAGGPPQAVSVTVQRVTLQRVPIALDAVGQAEGSREVEVRARVGGILEKRLYTEGAPVNGGATLFLI